MLLGIFFLIFFEILFVFLFNYDMIEIRVLFLDKIFALFVEIYFGIPV